MANYLTLPRLSTANYVLLEQTLPTWSRIYYEQNPELAYQLWVDLMNPSLSQRSGLERWYQTLLQRYQAEAGLNVAASPNWVGYLVRQDPNLLLASLPPEMRNISYGRYQRPLRWFAFM